MVTIIAYLGPVILGLVHVQSESSRSWQKSLMSLMQGNLHHGHDYFKSNTDHCTLCLQSLQISSLPFLLCDHNTCRFEASYSYCVPWPRSLQIFHPIFLCFDHNHNGCRYHAANVTLQFAIIADLWSGILCHGQDQCKSRVGRAILYLRSLQ